MPSIDKQGRITIPKELRKPFGLSTEIAICYNFEKKAITICNKSNVADKCVIAFLKTDPKGRFHFPNEVLDLFGFKHEQKFIFYIKNNELFLQGMARTST